ncbi:MAG: hypothetical protein ACRC92_06685 [Peptostreptococcaceae bacterium]
MGSKITIEGKDYTERVVESLEINGEITQTNIIDASVFGDNYTIEVNINTGEEIRGFNKEVELQVQTMENQNTNTTDLKIMEKIEDDKEIKKSSLLNRFINFIKNRFKNKS